MEKGIWFAQWHKDFNNYLVQNINYHYKDGKKKIEKQTLHSFIMGVDGKTPVKHCNGDTLDNRKCNLEIFDTNKPNDYIKLDDESIAIMLHDKFGNVKSKTLIDAEDLDRVINSGYVWVPHSINSEPYAVANTPNGRVFLNRFIMNTPEDMITHPINLNTLDNRKSNLENVTPNQD